MGFVNELRKRTAAYSDFYRKVEVFLYDLQTCQVLK